MESVRKGLSGMDAARAAMGQGWPFAACPWSGDGAKEPAAKRRAGCRARFLFGYFLFRASKEKVTRREAKPEASKPSISNHAPNTTGGKTAFPEIMRRSIKKGSP